MTEQDIANFGELLRNLSEAEKKQSDAHKEYVRLYNLWINECKGVKEKLDAQSTILQQSGSDIAAIRKVLDEKFSNHKI